MQCVFLLFCLVQFSRNSFYFKNSPSLDERDGERERERKTFEKKEEEKNLHKVHKNCKYFIILKIRFRNIHNTYGSLREKMKLRTTKYKIIDNLNFCITICNLCCKPFMPRKKNNNNMTTPNRFGYLEFHLRFNRFILIFFFLCSSIIYSIFFLFSSIFRLLLVV